MENFCLYCNNPFRFRRDTRKYCSNSCRQLDYYKRKKEFTVAGYFSVKHDRDSVKDFTLKPLTVKQQRDSVKDFTVKSLSKEAGQITLSDHQLDLLAEKVFALLQDRIEDIAYHKIFSVKDAVNVKDTVKDCLSVKDSVKEQELFAEESENTAKEPAIVKEERAEYTHIQSRFVDHIVQHLDRNNSDALSKFLYPHLCWTPEYTAKVKWVSLRFLCLVQSLIDFSRFRHVHNEDLKKVAGAFTSLENSKQFQALKEDYPHKELLHRLSNQINHVAEFNKNKEIIKCWVSPEGKAELIATRFEIGNFVPKIRFSELDFSQ